MQRITKHEGTFIYGISMALMLLLLKWLETHFIIFNYRLDFFIGAIAIYLPFWVFG
jgi:hypothetical protein